MPLSDKEILEARERGDIVIEPFDHRNLGTDSYDVRLGENFYRERSEGRSSFNLFDPTSAQRVWIARYARITAKVFFGDCPVFPSGWNPDDVVLPLKPGETILAHTHEFIGARWRYTTRMNARSSAGRSMIGVCKCAGKGDVGFFNRWTMEITSFSRYHTIPLKVGMRIAQIEFNHVGDTIRCYGGTHGKYQEGSDVQLVMKSWRPEMMLPRFHLDWELQNGK